MCSVPLPWRDVRAMRRTRVCPGPGGGGCLGGNGRLGDVGHGQQAGGPVPQHRLREQGEWVQVLLAAEQPPVEARMRAVRAGLQHCDRLARQDLVADAYQGAYRFVGDAQRGLTAVGQLDGDHAASCHGAGEGHPPRRGRAHRGALGGAQVHSSMAGSEVRRRGFPAALDAWPGADRPRPPTGHGDGKGAVRSFSVRPGGRPTLAAWVRCGSPSGPGLRGRGAAPEGVRGGVGRGGCRAGDGAVTAGGDRRRGRDVRGGSPGCSGQGQGDGSADQYRAGSGEGRASWRR